MTLGNKISQCRKNMNITQDALAKQLGVTNQAVSKWESDQCCPDVMLLPKLADIFGISIDALFGREVEPAEKQSSEDIVDIRMSEMFGREEIPEEEPRQEQRKSGFEKLFGISLRDLHTKANQQKWTPPAPTWPDDGSLRVVVYMGQKLMKSVKDLEKLTFQYEGPAMNVYSQISVTCADVEGNVDAGRTVCCGNVGGDVDAGTSVSCGNVEGNVDAGSHVGCGQVGGSVDAGSDVKCGDVSGNVEAGGNVECTGVEGNIEAGGSVTIRK